MSAELCAVSPRTIQRTVPGRPVGAAMRALVAALVPATASLVGAQPRFAPDGTWVGGTPKLAPNGTARRPAPKSTASSARSRAAAAVIAGAFNRSSQHHGLSLERGRDGCGDGNGGGT